MIEPTERATEHIASGLHRGLPGNGIDAKTRGDGRKLRIDIAHLIVTNGSAAPIDQREVLTEGERNGSSSGPTVLELQQRRRSAEHTTELQSRDKPVWRQLQEKKKKECGTH